MCGDKIKLVRLPSFFKKRQFSSEFNCCLIPPLGLGLITSFLRTGGFNVEQDDLNVKIRHDNHPPGLPEDAFDIDIFFQAQRIDEYLAGGNDEHLDSLMEKAASKVRLADFRIVLLSLPDNIENESNLLFALAFAWFIKKRFDPIIVIGGESLWLDLFRKRGGLEFVDHIVYGEGEVPLLELLNHILNGQQLSATEELSITDGGKILFFNGSSKPMKPDFSGLPLEYYRSGKEILDYPEEIDELMARFQSSKTLILPYRFMKGCPFECIFCVSSSKPLQNVLQPEEVVRHLASLQKEFNPSGFFFLSDTVNISKSYINTLCDEMIRKKINILWSDCARADNLDRDTLFKMREAGCIRLIFGMETASERLLKYINKKIDLAQLENALRWADEAGIWSGVEVICGLPLEQEEDVDSTIHFLNKNSSSINRTYLNHFDLRENTPLYNSPQDYGIERVFEVNQYAQKDFISYVRFGFDETGGLDWKDKARQIEHSLKKVQQQCAQGNRYFTDEHLLFFLYRYVSDKKKIDAIYQKVLKH